MSKFKKGDRVRYTGNCLKYGIVGTVVAFRKDWISSVGVRFDDASDYLYNLDGSCEDHHGWWALEKHLELANESEKPEFNVGDLVLIVGPKDPDCFDLVDRKTPKKTPKTPKKDPISGDEPRRVVIEITSEGAKAKYIHNGMVEKEARIHRWHGDRPDDAKAAKYAVDALFGVNKSVEDAEWASKTAEILNHMDWQDILQKGLRNLK